MVTGRHILKGIHLVRGRVSNIYIVEHGGGLIVVDAGMNGDSDVLVEYIKDMNRSLNDVEYIIVTHAHRDHVGGLYPLKGKTKALVVAHRAEVPAIEGATGIKADLVVEEGALIGPLRVVHTPGHTPGSICLYDAETKSLFVGDLVYEERGELNEIPHQYSHDPYKNRIAIASLLDLAFENVMPSHGEPVLGVGKEALRRLVKKLLLEVA
ncbi:MAG: MBL fold metallo-hydrolase [Desulfurococcaceae archaeon]